MPPLPTPLSKGEGDVRILVCVCVFSGRSRVGNHASHPSCSLFYGKEEEDFVKTLSRAGADVIAKTLLFISSQLIKRERAK